MYQTEMKRRENMIMNGKPAGVRLTCRLRAKSEELYVKLSDSQVSTNLTDPELSG